MDQQGSAAAAAEAEVATLVAELIRIDTYNYGNGQGPGEIAAADYCHQRLLEVGIDAERYTTTADHRAGVIARIAGRDPSRPALLVHGHLDVVPADADDWQVPPFAGEIDSDGMLWGRGAVDMKDMVGMTLAVVRNWARTGVQPDRDIVVLFVPDEEAGCVQGSSWLVHHRQGMFDGVTEAIGEVGGFSNQLDGRHSLYPIMTAEKGIAWIKLTARGQAGHGSLVAVDNAVAKVVAAAARVTEHEYAQELTPAVQQFLDKITELTGEPLDLTNGASLRARLGSMGRLVESTVRNTAQLTMLSAGYKHNVIPADATACIDARFLPGHELAFLAEIQSLIGGSIGHEMVHHDIALEFEFAGPLVNAMSGALLAHDPEAIPVPYLMPGGTDAKALSLLGIACYGFSPLRLPPNLDFFGMFHAANERVPVTSLQFGVRVLDEFLRKA